MRSCMLLIIALLALPNAAAAQVKFLEQNWDEETRQFFYTTSQGSRIMPYEWFLAMEEPGSERSFLRDLLPELGYLPNENTANNPDRLPVGFVRDDDWSGKAHLGLTCAACHTSQLDFEGQIYQIDGGPSMADIWGFLKGIGDALNATVDDPAKFDRFATKVLGNAEGTSPSELRQDLGEFLEYWNQFIEDSTTEHPWGRARLDAFGMIFNRATAINLDIPENNVPPDAPVSYPFLWGTSWEDRVQWIGSAPNTNDIERLGRNIGEVLGVFAQADMRKASLFRPYYRTSARRLNQLRLENRLKKLWSPVWPGEIDEAKAEAGRVLFDQHCVHCHQVIPHGKQDTPVDVVMTPLSKVGTDRRTAVNAATGEVRTGRLNGSRIPGLPALEAIVPRGVLLSNVGRGALLSPFRDVELDLSGLKRLRARIRGFVDEETNLVELGEREIHAFFREADVDEADFAKLMAGYEEKLERYRSGLRSAIEASATNTLESVEAAEGEQQVLAYKARPLDGIWATAPYLHNGSVPNLYELLLPTNMRTTQFHVGSIRMDTERVGFSTESGPGTTLLDTTLPGNSNAGHDTYGNAEFTEEQRWELVEYMKSL